MNTFDESNPLTAPLPAGYQMPLEQELVSPPIAALINPDNPVWSVFVAVMTWAGSIILLLGVQLVVGIIYIAYLFILHSHDAEGANILQNLQNDKTLIFISILSTLPAHALTMLLVWAVVTQLGKYPFWQTLGWSRGAHFGFWTSAGMAVLLLVVVGLLAQLIGVKETDLDKIVNSSAASRYTLAFLATFTAPIVEETVYRGVLYPALLRAFSRLGGYFEIVKTEKFGTIMAVILVSALFAAVHVFQYWNSVAVILGVTVLSLSLTLVRAYTGKLLPCFIIHTVFNGIQSIYIAFGPYFEKYFHAQPEPKAPALLMLAHVIHNFI